MANIKSKEKSIGKQERARKVNSAIKSRVRTFIKKARIAITSNDENAQKIMLEAFKELDKAVSKGVIHKNNAARRKSRLNSLYAKNVTKKA